MSVKDHENLKFFEMHGFKYKKGSGDSATGTCPFCRHKSNKFTITFTEKLSQTRFKCFNCDTAGGHLMFLEAILKMSRENFRGTIVTALCKNRHLKRKTLIDHKVGFNPVTNNYVIPSFDLDGKRVTNLHIYRFAIGNTKSVFLGSANCTSGLFYGHTIASLQPHDKRIIWIVEGHWDRMTMYEIIKNLGRDDLVVAVPGANTFSDYWIDFFRDKIVFVTYDNDHDILKGANLLIGAGKRGMNKVAKKLLSVPNKIKFINWPKKTPHKFDIGDLYQKNTFGAMITYDMILEYLRDNPPEIKEAQRSAPTQNIATPDEVIETYTKWLKMDNTDVIDIIFGTVFANRLPGDPVWMFLVGPSGFAKTELCMGISKSSQVIAHSSLTPAGLISGAQGKDGTDPSLIPQLRNKILVIKDFTTIMALNQLQKSEIFGILRDAFDGSASRKMGNICRTYHNVRFGIIAGVTPAIEMEVEGMAKLGERFLYYRIPFTPTYKAVMEILNKAFENVTFEDQMQREIRNISSDALNYTTQQIPTISDEMKQKLMHIAHFTSILRGAVVRDQFRHKEILYNPFKEIATRILKQIKKLAIGIAIFRRHDTITSYEYRHVKATCKGSIPSRREAITEFLYKDSRKERSTNEICQKIRLPGPTVKDLMDDLRALEAVKRVIGENSHNQYWKLTDEIINIIKIAGVYDE